MARTAERKPTENSQTPPQSTDDTGARSNLPSHGVYVVEGDGDGAFWIKIGGAWPHADGQGFNIVLSAMPLNGKLVVRKPKSNG